MGRGVRHSTEDDAVHGDDGTRLHLRPGRRPQWNAASGGEKGGGLVTVSI